MQQIWAARQPSYADHVDAQGGRSRAQLSREAAQGAFQAVELLLADAAFGGRMVLAGLDLDGDPGPAAPDQQVDLAVDRAQVACLYAVASTGEGGGGQGFAGGSGPGGWRSLSSSAR